MSTSTPFLDTAFAIGARLCRDAVWDGRRCNWLGPSMEAVGGEWKVVQRTFGPDLYAGTSGIALFLARLYRLTGEPILARTAEAAARQALSRADGIQPSVRLGFYTGLTGIAYACAELGETLGDERWTGEARRLLGSLGDAGLDGCLLDVLAGVAGAIPALIDLGPRLGDGSLPDLAVRLGDHLLARARRRKDGWSWETLASDQGELIDDLLGFSHGTGGIAWALAELHRASREERFRAAAEEGFRYERRWFSSRRENWPDLRKLGPETGAGGEDSLFYAVQWCHGAAGIGLSRLRAWELLGGEVYRAEAEAALRTTCRDLSVADVLTKTNYSLCHGRAGNADLFLEASRILGQPAWHCFAEQVGWQGIAAYESQGLPWPGGVQGALETPNLMLGAAGTGHFYLRLHDPRATPSVLMLVPGAGEAAVESLPRVA